MNGRRGFLLLGGVLLLMLVLIAQNMSSNETNFPPTDEATTAPIATLPAVRENALFPALAVMDILAINLRDPVNETYFTISRSTDGTWTAPSNEGQLDTDAATAIARTIVLLNSESTQSVDAETDFDAFGFAEGGRLFVEFLLTDETGHAVAVGGLTEDRELYYVLVDDRPNLYLIPRGPLDFLSQSLENPPIN